MMPEKTEKEILFDIYLSEKRIRKIVIRMGENLQSIKRVASDNKRLLSNEVFYLSSLVELLKGEEK